MKAFIMNEERKLVVADMPNPTPKDNNAIIKIKYASICGTDVRTYTKGNEKLKTLPRIQGHECVGTLCHVGALAKELGYAEGDRVTIAPAIGCGECWPCKQGRSNMCDHLETIGWEYEGTFAEYLEVPEKALRHGHLIKVPDDVSDESATLAEPAGCAMNAQMYMDVQPDDYVVIYGSGFIGCVHAEIAFLKGASKVIMVEIAEERAELAQRMIPGIIMINPKYQNTVEEVARITEGRGANVVITALSVPSCHTEAQIIAAKMGRISLFGGIVGESKGWIDSNLIHYKELGVFGVHATRPNLMKEVMRYVEEGKLDLDKYVSGTVKLENIEDGFAKIRDENALKILVEP